MNRLHYLQHVPFEGLGTIADWASRRGMNVSCSRLFENEVCFPDQDEFDVLVIMGGPMSVHDVGDFPWLTCEKQFIKASIESGKHVLGICLGAQLIASALDADVVRNTCDEIGWFPIAFSDDVVGHPLLSGFSTAITVFHWHGDKFEIPEGSIHLAHSQACDNQGYIFGDRVVGLQFHMEMDKIAIEKIVDACKTSLGTHNLSNATFVQSEEEINTGIEKYDMTFYMHKLLDNWLGCHKV